MIVQSSRLAAILFLLPAYAKSGARLAHSDEKFSVLTERYIR